MKNNIFKDRPYKDLIYKILFKTALIILLAIFIVILFADIGRGNLANNIVSFIKEKYNLDWYSASNFYWIYVRRYIDLALIIAVIILIILFFRFLLSWFTKYFDEIIEGVNTLSNYNNEKIKLSKELKFMEDKLNEVKEKLERSAMLEREEEKRKNDLMVYLAHDIKTPLTSVIGYLSLLEENPNLKEEEKIRYTHITLEKAYALEKLVNEFFEVARYNLQSVPLNKEKINICYIMVQIIDELYPRLANKNQKVENEVYEDLFLNVDPEKIARVFNNILKNAINYGMANSKIKISSYVEDNLAYIKFKNLGTIPEDKIQYIFDKFYRADESRQSETGGSGLGLAIAKDIVSLHLGEIKVSVDDYYTTFTVILPI